jgi:hypothetical protein
VLRGTTSRSPRWKYKTRSGRVHFSLVTAAPLGMSTLSARATYKKQSGTLALTASHVVWTKDGTTTPQVRIVNKELESESSPELIVLYDELNAVFQAFNKARKALQRPSSSSP